MTYIVITGASSGLGWEFAHQYAARGNNLIITARRHARLVSLAEQLRQQYQVSVEIIVADLSQEGVDVIADTIKRQGWPIIGLVNNAGFGLFDCFASLPWSTQNDLMQVNMFSLVKLTYRLISLFKDGNKSFICNVASIAAFQAGPGAALYYASKAFVLSFSQALNIELKGRGIHVNCLCPGVTATEFFQISSGKELSTYHSISMSAEKVVKIAIKKMSSTVVITGARNRWVVWLGSLLPRIYRSRLAYLFNRAKK